MSEYIYENVPHPKCDEAGCMEPGWFAWDGVLRCRRHHAALEDLVSREKATKTRLERLTDHLYVALVQETYRRDKHMITDDELDILCKRARRYASHMVDE